MTKKLLGMMMICAGLPIGTLMAQTTTPSATQTQESEGWTLIWSEEFNTDGDYNHQVWDAEHGYVRNHEAQWYQEENAYQKDGCLVIEARKEGQGARS